MANRLKPCFEVVLVLMLHSKSELLEKELAVGLVALFAVMAETVFSGLKVPRKAQFAKVGEEFLSYIHG